MYLCTNTNIVLVSVCMKSYSSVLYCILSMMMMMIMNMIILSCSALSLALAVVYIIVLLHYFLHLLSFILYHCIIF